ncbi:hypothetical protein K493DRAFT_315069 [Basidiobolus meristosporus CBS 931.73]|uniref:RNI-like protein n=1 Tax=Basidiobolus meristosporus CBS 931.73 TaxID=1314790 RepID=A0A1Y1YC53_9FUNG|nr:hypothetical protein K493DRAFT_315069 [Basidiobolus meristosporus CBS 931.73]|eukprot:ORX95296.1 hypothetical protein K493DRAFT_315069 [Basidiobolus meristosporus CBS 931.73]
MTDGLLRLIAENAPFIKELRITNSEYVTDLVLEFLIEKCIYLNRLHIIGNSEVAGISANLLKRCDHIYSCN